MWKPLRSIRNLFRRRDPSSELDQFAWNPSFDIVEKGEGYRLSTEVPGVEPCDLHVMTIGSRIQISGRREGGRAENFGELDLFERRRDYFARWFTLPDDADLAHATGELDGAILTVVVPRLAPNTQ